MAELTMSVDGWSSTNVGFHVTNPDSYRMSPAREWVVEQAPLRARQVLMSQTPRYEARELVVEGHISASSASSLIANRDELIARLDDAGEIEVTFSDDPSRVYDCRFVGSDQEHRTLASQSRDTLTLTFLMLDPFVRDAGLTTVAFGATPTEVPLGTAPVEDAVIRVHGPSTNPSVRLSQAGLFHLEDGASVVPPSTDATFSRAATATYTDSAGRIRSASSGQVRKHHYVDDEDGHRTQARKLEAARTNSLLDSEALGSTNWTTSSVALTTPAGLTAPDGSTTVFRLDDSTGSSVGHLLQDVALTGGTTDATTLSCFLRRQPSTGSFPAIELEYRGSTAGNFSGGVVVDTTGRAILDGFGSTGQIVRSGVLTLSTGADWVRPWVAVANDGSTGSQTARAKLIPAASTGSGTKASLTATHDFWGAQLEGAT